MRPWFLDLALVLVSCKSCPAPVSDAAAPDAADAASPAIEVANVTAEPVTVSVTFGSDSVVLPAAWNSFCTALETGAVGCSFKLAVMGGGGTKIRIAHLAK